MRSFKDYKENILKRTRNKPITLTGKIIHDSSLKISAYFEKARKITEEGPLALSSKEIDTIRLFTTEELENIYSNIENKNFISSLLSSG